MFIKQILSSCSFWGLILLLAISCTKNTTLNQPVSPIFSDTVINGCVINSAGIGIANIIIQDNQGNTQVTDSKGNFRFILTAPQTVLSPKNDNYTFSPAQMKVNGLSDNVVFTGISSKISSEQKMINWLNNAQLPNGLVPSTDYGNQISLYDNALAALVFTSYADYTRAEKIFDFFNSRITSELQMGSGGYSQFRTLNGTPNNHRWLGDNAWLLIALDNYVALTGSTKYNNLIQQLNSWIRSLQDTDGGLWGGQDANNNQIGKITEGNMDAFAAIDGYDNFHSNLLSYFKNQRWDAVNKCFIAWPGNYQYLYALDNFSWGFGIFPYCPTTLLTQANIFLTTQTATATNNQVTGYCFDEDKDDIWLEGTGEMVVAFQIAGQTTQANYYLSQIEKTIINSPLNSNSQGIPYATNLGTSYGGGALWQGSNTQPYLSSVEWYLFGKHNFDPFKVCRNKNIPASSKFWMN